jgi:hypothetical protein
MILSDESSSYQAEATRNGKGFIYDSIAVMTPASQSSSSLSSVSTPCVTDSQEDRDVPPSLMYSNERFSIQMIQTMLFQH